MNQIRSERYDVEIRYKVKNSALMSEIGALVRQAREDAGVDLRDLAGLLGVGEKTLSSIEAGRKSVQIPDLYNIALSLGCSPRELFPEWMPPDLIK